jgi:trehalose 6-phosphate synthase/phosphatase
MRSARVVIVSNRLPVTLAHDQDGVVSIKASSGGLATALKSVHSKEGSKSIWIGWPGPASLASDELQKVLEPLRCVGVDLTPAEVMCFYDNFSNGVLWPLCHYLLDKVLMDVNADWKAYQSVNQKFADAVVANVLSPTDLVWIHDYQLMLVPSMVRLRLPDARIGYFHHIPFPSADVFKTLPWRRQLLEGLLGADVIGFHTASYVHNFCYSCSSVLGLESTAESVTVDGRPISVAAFPIGIDANAFKQEAVSAEVAARVAEFRNEAEGRKIVLSVDRLDYTKGIIRRLLSIERLLEQHPELVGNLHILQLAVPTRENVDSYVDYRSAVNELVGRINGRFSIPMRSVVHFMYRSVSAVELSAMYVAADVMVVTPLRDGMNLVCKEYVASRVDNRGVLVLSEFAGASVQLQHALQVNPYDVDEVARQLFVALQMPTEEQERRMTDLRHIVGEGDVSKWASSFLGSLSEKEVNGHSVDLPLVAEVARLIKAPHLVLFLDYDGTLVEICKTPADAVPTPELLSLLSQLCGRRRTDVHIVSGRSRGFLEKNVAVAHSRLFLHAEHGVFSREPGVEAWRVQGTLEIPAPWMADVQRTMDTFARITDGAFVERKSASLCFHYRSTEPQLAEHRLSELVRSLVALNPERSGFELLYGSKVLEVRIQGVSKALPLQDVLQRKYPEGTEILAIGDDVTDEHMFKALPGAAVTIHVGSGATSARFRLPHVEAVHALLRNIANDAPTPTFKKKDTD